MDYKEALLQPQSEAPSGEEGYASGNEEFVDAPEKDESLPVSGSSVSDGDVEIEKGQEGVEGNVLEKKIDTGLGEEVGEVAGIENSDVNGEVLDPKVLDSGGEVKIEEKEYENGGNEMNGHEGKEVAEDAVIESEESDFDRGDGVTKVTPEGDSVVDSVQVDVASPGVAVVGETDENEDDKVSGLKVEENDVSEELVEEGEKRDVVDDVEEAKQTPEGDSIVDTISVDVASPGVAVVGETEENGDAQKDFSGVKEVSGEPNKFEANVTDAIADSDNKPELKEVDDADVSEPEKLESAHHNHDLKLTPEGYDAVDSVSVDEVETGAAVVGYEEDENRVESVGEKIPVESDGGTIESKNRDEDDEKAITREAATEPEGKSAGDDAAVPKSVNETNQKPDDREVDDDLANEIQTPSNNNFSADNGETIEVEDQSKTSETEPANIYQVDDDDLNSQKVAIKPEDYSVSDGDVDDDIAIFGRSEAANKFMEELEQESSIVSHTIPDDSTEIIGQIVTDSEEDEGETDDEGEGKEMFDSAAFQALLRAATGADSSDGGSITITSQDGSRLFTVDRPAGLGSSIRSFRPASQTNRANIFSSLTPSARGGEPEENLSEEEKEKLEKLQQIRVKFLRLVHRLGLSPEESVAAQVLYRLALLGGRPGSQTFSLDEAKTKALELEERERDDLQFSINVLVLGKSGVGKSATINSLFGEEMTSIGAFEPGTASAKVISGSVDGINVRVIDTPGLKSSMMEQGFNRGVLSSVNKMMKKTPPDVVLYVDRLDSQTRDLNDLPLLRTVTSALGSSIWRSAIVTLTHGASAPPDGPSGTPLSYEVFVSQRSHVLQQSIGHAVGNLRMLSPSVMNPVSLVENHTSCRRNREGQKILPNGQSWRPQLLLLCYSMKILSEASSLSKPQDPFDHRKLFGFQARAPPLPYMLSSMLQSRTHPKLPSDQGGDSVDSDIDLDDLSDSDDEEEEDEYEQLPPFKPLKKAQLAKLTGEQRKAYFEEYDYRVKLLQKKQWREELKRMRELKKRGKGAAALDYAEEDDADSGAAAPVSVPLPDMALPPSFDGDNPAYRYRFLEPTSQFLARPVLDSHGWDHDCGYDGVNVEHSLAIANRFPVAYTVQVTKDKKDFSLSLDSSVSAKHGDNLSTMAGFDIQSMGKQMAYIIRGETKTKNLKKHKAAGGISFTFLGENVVPGVKIEDQVMLGRRYVLVGSAGAVKSKQDTAYGANFEVQRREADYPIGQVQSSVSMSVIKWRGDLALGFNGLAQLSVGRNSKVAVRAGINNKRSGQITVRTSSSEHLSLALTAIIPTALSIYRKLFPVGDEKYSIY